MDKDEVDDGIEAVEDSIGGIVITLLCVTIGLIEDDVGGEDAIDD